jgi:hypothetical protein
MKNKYYLLLVGVFFLINPLFAQNTEVIANAPDQLKIDGKLIEFSDSLVNYDKTTKLNYALAHDAKNLYVFIKAIGKAEQNKIMAGGISISVNASGKKKASSTITFPVVDRAAMMAEMKNRVGQPRDGSQRVERTPEEKKAERIAMQKKVLGGLKEIKISGLKDISLESISIYNTYGIKTGINYNDKNALVYELAIPLELVNVTLANDPEISINIKVNGLEIPETSSGGGGFGGGGMAMGMGGGGFSGGRPGGADISSMFTPTEFWIKTKFAK